MIFINPGNINTEILFTTPSNLETEEGKEIHIQVTEELLNYIFNTVYELPGTPKKSEGTLQEYKIRTTQIALANLDISEADTQTFFSTGTLPDDCFFDDGDCFYGTIFEEEDFDEDDEDIFYM